MILSDFSEAGVIAVSDFLRQGHDCVVIFCVRQGND